MKHLFIVNPTAGGKDRTEEVKQQAAQIFSEHTEEYEVYTTTGPMDACRKIKEDAQTADKLRVYACGGDGTLNECVNGAVGHENTAVTTFPNGTGNDFVKIFGGEKSRFFSLEELVSGETRPIDIIDCNGRYSVNICSVGIDARIGVDVHRFSRLPFVKGIGAYILSVIGNVFKGITDELTVRCGSRTFKGKMNLVCMCNGTNYGGGFNPVPEAKPDDGIIDTLIVSGANLFDFARLIGEYGKGNYAKYPKYITHVQGTEIEIHSDKELVINVDGEEMRSKTVKCAIIPLGVNFIFPKGLKYFADRSASKENERESILA